MGGFEGGGMKALSRHIAPLSVALRERDAYTDGHCDRVERLCQLLAQRCGVGARSQGLIAVAAKIHDVGKVGIPDHILLKPGSFTPEEWDVMKTHSEMGQRVCEAIEHPHNQEIGHIVRHHHEAIDGSGYPDGLLGTRIPIEARIISIVDAYDAMTTTRPYHHARSHDEALSILDREKGRKFDGAVLEQFLAVVS